MHKKLLKNIFYIQNKNNHKVLNILGLKIKIRIKDGNEDRTEELLKNLSSEIVNRQTYINQRLLTASITNHNAFTKFRGCLKGKTVVLVAAGPTVKDFTPIDGAVYVGCNRAFLLDNVNFDFLFAIDKVGIQEYYKEFFEYRTDKCIKFIGDQNLGPHYQIPENIIPIEKNIYRYITTAGLSNISWTYPLDISIAPLLNPPTVSLQAMQFILWTQPEKVYIVGVDCTCATLKHFTGKNADCTFRNENIENNDLLSVELYKSIKEFAQTYYPQTRIISVNPVGLKGIFEDVYTKTYIEKNKNIIDELGNNLKILEE